MNDMDIFYGNFEVEKEWSDPGIAKFPETSMQNWNSKLMEELLYGIADEGVLLLHNSFNSQFEDYLRAFDFTFKTEKIDDFKCEEIKNHVFHPYAIDQDFLNLIEKKRMEFPKLEDVIRVNSKVYSTAISGELNCSKGSVVTSIEELRDLAENYTYDFMLKEPAGVSGKGNLHLNSERQYRSIDRYLEKQIKAGKKLCLIVEPFLKINADFSTQYVIHKNGSYEFICVRKIINKGVKYSGSCKADEKFVKWLLENGYFEVTENIIKRLHQDGYWGNVCIDSAILDNNEIIPVIEINARKSMGIISYKIESHVLQEGASGSFRIIDIITQGEFDFSILKDMLKSKGLLVEKKGDQGIFLASANTYKCNNEHKKGRIYFYAIGSNLIEEEYYYEMVKKLLGEIKIVIC